MAHQRSFASQASSLYLRLAQQKLSRRILFLGGSLLPFTTSCGSPPPTASPLQIPSSHPLGALLYTYRGHTGGVETVAWFPDGKRLASGSDDKTVQVWDAANGGHISIYRGHSSPVWTVAWSPDGTRLVSGSRDATAQVWEATTGRTLLTYRGHSTGVNAVAWSPDGKQIASGSDGATAQVWVAG